MVMSHVGCGKGQVLCQPVCTSHVPGPGGSVRLYGIRRLRALPRRGPGGPGWCNKTKLSVAAAALDTPLAHQFANTDGADEGRAMSLPYWDLSFAYLFFWFLRAVTLPHKLLTLISPSPRQRWTQPTSRRERVSVLAVKVPFPLSSCGPSAAQLMPALLATE